MTTAALDELILPADEIADAATVDAYTPEQWVATHAGAISASEIAAVLGISPWDSPFALHWRKRSGWVTPSTLQMRVGKVVEPVIAAEFTERHPELTVVDVGTFRHAVRRWQIASPDRLAWAEDREPIPVELKSEEFPGDEWGEDGSDVIPVHYRAQLLWQCDTLHARRGYLAAMFGKREIRVYQVDHDPSDAALMRSEALAFLDALHAGDPPSLDAGATTATRRALQRLHPDVDEDLEVELPAGLADRYLRAHRLAARVKAQVERADNDVRAALGRAKRGMRAGEQVVSRSVYDQRRLAVKDLRTEVEELRRREPRPNSTAGQIVALVDRHTVTTTVDRLNSPRGEQ